MSYFVITQHVGQSVSYIHGVCFTCTSGAHRQHLESGGLFKKTKKKTVEGHWMNVSLRFLLSQWNQMVHQTATKAHQKGVKTSFPTLEAVGVLHSSSSDEEMLSSFDKTAGIIASIVLKLTAATHFCRD